MKRCICRILMAGALLGCLLLGLTSTAGARVTLECSADFYAFGDSVFFTRTNDTGSTLTAACHPSYEIYDDISGEFVYSEELPWEYSPYPGESVFLDWNQIDWRGEQVPPRPYQVRITFRFNG